MTLEFITKSIEDTALVAEQIVASLKAGDCVYLHGAMGAGKTTLTKYLLQSMGHQGPVTSPTYNLIQNYSVSMGDVYHMDLYRLEDPSEIEFLGLEDLWNDKAIFLIEWPEKGSGYLPMPSVEIEIKALKVADESVRKIIFHR